MFDISFPTPGTEPERSRTATPLRAHELLESALKREKRRDFADRSFIHPFERLLKACNEEADLSVFGVRALRIDVLRCLRNLLRFRILFRKPIFQEERTSEKY